MCLINVAHEHLTTQTGKKSKPALVNVMGPGAEGPRGRGPRAEGREKQIPGYLFFSALGPRPHMSALSPSAPRPHKFYPDSFKE